jgi:hypothetical protein
MLTRILKWFLIVIGAIAALIALFFFSMRFHDGPMEIIAGGPFQSGELVQGPEPDWSFLRDRATIEFQIMDPPTSRVIWLAVYENKLYVLSAYMKTGVGKIWKKWPRHVERDNRALLRVDGKIYRRQLIRLTADDLKEGISREFDRKYNARVTRESISSGGTWFYELAPASASARGS